MCLLLPVMGKASDPTDFDRRQNWIAQWLIMSIAEIAHLVGCLWHIILGTYAKWMNEGKTISRCHVVGPPQYQRKKMLETLPLGKTKLA